MWASQRFATSSSSTFDCPDGELQITFSPTQDSNKQSASWRIVEDSGTGSYEGLRASGEMQSVFGNGKKRNVGRAQFTGTTDP